MLLSHVRRLHLKAPTLFRPLPTPSAYGLASSDANLFWTRTPLLSSPLRFSASNCSGLRTGTSAIFSNSSVSFLSRFYHISHADSYGRERIDDEFDDDDIDDNAFGNNEDFDDDADFELDDDDGGGEKEVGDVIVDVAGKDKTVPGQYKQQQQPTRTRIRRVRVTTEGNLWQVPKDRTKQAVAPERRRLSGERADRSIGKPSWRARARDEIDSQYRPGDEERSPYGRYAVRSPDGTVMTRARLKAVSIDPKLANHIQKHRLGKLPHPRMRAKRKQVKSLHGADADPAVKEVGIGCSAEHTHTQTHTPAPHTHLHTHTYTNTNTHIHTHTQTHTYTHTYTHTERERERERERELARQGVCVRYQKSSLIIIVFFVLGGVFFQSMACLVIDPSDVQVFLHKFRRVAQAISIKRFPPPNLHEVAIAGTYSAVQSIQRCHLSTLRFHSSSYYI